MGDDFSVSPLSNNWDDTQFGGEKYYIVQTHTKTIQRCVTMTTDPGDLVFDPTCGSGTTAYVAGQWGRRWITCDTSRVAITLARNLKAEIDEELIEAYRGTTSLPYEAGEHRRVAVKIVDDRGIENLALRNLGGFVKLVKLE